MKKFEFKNLRASESPKWSDSHISVDVYYNNTFIMTYNYNIFITAKNKKIDLKLNNILQVNNNFSTDTERIKNAFNCIDNIFSNFSNKYNEKAGRATLLNMFRIYPSDKELMQCIASDYQAFKESNNFEDFCFNYGYESDSIQALNIYNSLKEQFITFNKVFNNSELQEIINTEY